jgi:DNA-binding NarL/FixJ family response regulator
MLTNPRLKTKILIVDDHAMVRSGIAMLVNQEADLHVCCEAEDIERAISANRACKHDLAIVDLSLNSMSGLELIKQFKLDSPNMYILIMSMHDEAVYAEQALRAGAHGYLMKQAATATMLKAIRQVLSGELYVSDQMRSRLLKNMWGGGKDASQASQLTPSEFEVLHLIGLGLGTSQISQKLNRHIKTIESHRANIKRKLGLKSGNELARYAYNLSSQTNPSTP